MATTISCLTINVERRRWWRCLGRAGLLLVYIGLRLRLPLRCFVKWEIAER